MKNNIKILTILVLTMSLSVFTACKKDENTNIDYSKIKIKQEIVNYIGFTIDTFTYTYNNNDIIIKETSNSSSISKITTYTYSANQYNISITTNGTPITGSGKYILNTKGFIDSVHNAFSLVVNEKYTYDELGRLSTRNVVSLGESNYNYTYNTENDILYYIYNSVGFSSKNNIFECEYYTNKELKVVFDNTDLKSLKGLPEKHLIKKISKKDLNNSNKLIETTEFTYETDNKGLVTKRIKKIYDQPGNMLRSTIISQYTYYE